MFKGQIQMTPKHNKETINPHDASLALKQTLAQQMQITERDISDRKSLLGFTSEHEHILTRAKFFAEQNVNEIVDDFYKTQLNHSEIALLIGDLHTLTKLKTSMRRYILDLFEGYYDMEYVDKRLRIGKVHHRIGVSPKLYVSAMSRLQNAIEKVILPFIASSENQETQALFHEGLRQLFMFDMQLVFDTYIITLVTEVEAAKNEMEVYADSLEQIIAERTSQLEELSSLDALTGLYNQRVFYQKLRREISIAERVGSQVSLIYFDINGFKQINDTQGHNKGDEILKFIGSVMLKNTRKMDVPCRYGGDEFCIILPNAEQQIVFDKVAQRLIQAFQKDLTYDVNISMGIAQTGPKTYCDPEELVKVADKLMYKAKARSKTKPGTYIEMDGVNKVVSNIQEVEAHQEAVVEI